MCLTETAIQKVFSLLGLVQDKHIKSIESFLDSSSLVETKIIRQILHRIPNLLLTQKNVVILSPENVVVENGENVVGGLGFNPKNVVFGLKNVVKTNQETSPYPSENVVVDTQKTHWAAVQAAHALVGKMPLSCVLARLYNEARTYFQSET